jgi:hypothetical protein
MLPKMGFKVKVVVPVVARRVELEEPPGVAEGLQDMGLSLSILGGVRKRLGSGTSRRQARSGGGGRVGRPSIRHPKQDTIWGAEQWAS